MEVRAKIRGVRFTPQKGRLVAGLIRKKSASRALEILHSCEKSAAGPIEKLLRSALANAVEHNSRHQAGIDLDNLYVKTIVVDEGRRSWKVRPRAQGRAAWIKKGTSHVTVVLDER